MYMYMYVHTENDCVWTNGNRGPAVPASENPGGTWGGKRRKAGLLHPIYPGRGVIASYQTNHRSRNDTEIISRY